MTLDQKIQLAVAVGTIAVAVLAVWGEPIRYFFGVRPRLRLVLHDPMGEPIAISEADGSTTPSRYYHVRVFNRFKSIEARNVRVVIVRLARPAADGSMVAQPLAGPLQLMWRFSALHAPSAVVGSEDFSDLGYLKKGEHFRLTPFVAPNNFPGSLKPGERLIVELKALADNAESQSLCIEVSWDGKWDDDSAAMANHLVVKAVRCP
jgi:hypothetical protein